jgi:hypothetical protein
VAAISRSRGWSVDFILWGLSYAAGLRIIWADAVANGQTVRRVYEGESTEVAAGKHSMREKFKAMREARN